MKVKPASLVVWFVTMFSCSWEEMQKGSCFYSGIYAKAIDEHGEGNGNPLQCSCLENPMDGEAW